MVFVSDFIAILKINKVMLSIIMLLSPAGPTIDTLPAEVEVDIYDNVTLECVVSGFPKPKIVWLRNGETFNDTDVTLYVLSDITVSSTLSWRRIRSMDAGVYTCNAVNSAGGVAADVELIVLGKQGNWWLII
jgi:hypothetical protein